MWAKSALQQHNHCFQNDAFKTTRASNVALTLQRIKMTTIGRLGIQQENQQALDRMRAIASRFKSDPPGFEWLIEILELNSESAQRGVLVSLNQTPNQRDDTCEGVWLSVNRRFFEFSVRLPHDGGPPKPEFWNDVTEDIIVNAHQPGTGKSFGFLAMDLLDEALKS